MIRTSFSNSLFRSGLLLCAFTTLASAQGDLFYKVDVHPDTGMLHVTITVPNTRHGAKFQLPNWGPGGYSWREGYKNVQNLVAHDRSGKSLMVDQKLDNIQKTYTAGDAQKVVDIPVCTWTTPPCGETVVEYDIANKPVDGAVHWGGPATYLYETTRRLEKCVLTIDVPQGWPVYLGLDETHKGSNTYVAKTYDVLADNPVSTGDLLVDTYECRGKMHYIVMRGAAKANVDRAKLIKNCMFVSEIETDFFGDQAPYDKYVWHFAVNNNADGAGGLEHLSSTEISLAAGDGPRVRDVLAHEFFHLWNVKRIRSKPLGPFDYTKLPETGAIWWLEGVTDYYAYTLPHRYKGTSDQEYFAAIASNLQAVRNNPAYTQVSPNESSMRVDEANNGHGNSNGYLISYYNLGWLAGMCLDIEMRSHTADKHSLDDVEHALWDLCKNDKPGFAEDEIRKQYIKIGGPEMGDVYDRIVMKPNGMDIEATLAKVGLKILTTPQEYTDIGFTIGGGPGGAGPLVATVHGAAEGKLQPGDRITAIDGTKIEAGQGRSAAGGGGGRGAGGIGRLLRNPPADQPIKLTVERNGESVDVEFMPGTATRDIYSIERATDATAEQKKLGAEWLYTKDYKP